MDNNEVYCTANTARHSSSYHRLPKNFDQKFNCRLLGKLVIHFLINAAITGLWAGAAVAIWTNWGRQYKQSTKHNCNLETILARATNVSQMNAGGRQLSMVLWKSVHATDSSSVLNDKLRISGSGVYAVTSVISFRCPIDNNNNNDQSKSFYAFDQHLHSSRGESFYDRQDSNRSSTGSAVCYRSFIYATFELEEGDDISVQVGSHGLKGMIPNIDTQSSYISLFRIRNPQRCPRSFCDPKVGPTLIEEKGLVDNFRREDCQKVFAAPKRWWSNRYILNYDHPRRE